MKKIGVITFHFCQNYGAVLQNYALIEFLRENGTCPYTLNMISELQENNNSMYACKKGIKKIIRNIVLSPFHFFRLKKKEKFDDFVVKYLNTTERVNDSQELSKLIAEENFDVVITGSDQVWNPLNHDFNRSFFFPFKTKVPKYGYAVSFGNAQYSDLIGYKDSIEDFKCVGYRENSSEELLKHFNVNSRKNIDPVLLIDRAKWISLSTNSSIEIEEKYILCYFINKKLFNTYFEVAKSIGKFLNYKVVVINAGFGRNSIHRNTILDAGPEDFLALIRNAQFVCTDSFHGTVFASIFNKQFTSFIPQKGCIDSRVLDYLKSIGLNDRIVYGDSTHMDVSTCCCNRIDYNPVEIKIKNEVQKSISYLREITGNQDD